jgi:hypothetical protein
MVRLSPPALVGALMRPQAPNAKVPTMAAEAKAFASFRVNVWCCPTSVPPTITQLTPGIVPPIQTSFCPV